MLGVSGMGLIGTVLTSAAREAGKIIALEGLDAASKAVSNAADSITGAAEKYQVKLDKKVMGNRPDNTFLYLQFAKAGLSAGIRVFDQEDNEPYSITGIVDKPLFSLKVSRGSEYVGTVKKKLLALRVPLIHERNPLNLSITMFDGSEFEVRTKITPTGRRFDVEPCGWCIKSLTTLISDFTGKRGESTIFSVSKRSGYKLPTYLLDFEDEGYEELALMVSLGIIYDNCFGG